MIKQIKTFLDAGMVILLMLLLPAAKISPSLHIFWGFALITAIVIHLLLNGKWLLISIKKLFRGKLNPKTRYMLMLVLGLIIAFSVCSFSGIAIYQSGYYASGDMFAGRINHSMQSLYGLHGMSAAACIILTILHVRVHWGYIKSFIRGNNAVPKSGCEVEWKGRMYNANSK